MNIELPIEYIYYLGTAFFGVVVGVSGLLIAQRLLNKKDQAEATQEESMETSETAVEETTDLIQEEVADTAETDSHLTAPTVEKTDNKSFFDEDFLATRHEVEPLANYDTELYRKIGEDYSRIIEKFQAEQRQEQQENTTPSGTGFAPKLPVGSRRTHRARRVYGQVRYTGTVQSPNPGEFPNQVFPKD